MQFHADARRGNIEGIRQGLKRGLCIDLFEREDGETPLMAALGRMDSTHPVKPTLDTIRFILEQGANPALGTKWSCPIRLAVAHGDVATVKLLEEFGAEITPNSASEYGVAVDSAYRVIRGGAGAMEMLEYLAGRGLNWDVNTPYRESPVSVCYHHGEMVALRRLFEVGASPGPLKWGAAHLSVWHAWLRGDTSGLIVSEETDCWGCTPFHLAVALNSPALMQALMDAGADPAATISDRAGYVSPALHRAACCDAPDAIRWLAENGADVEATGFNAETPLLAAIGAGSLAAIDQLLRQGASPEARDEYSGNIFHAVHAVETFLAISSLALPERLNVADACGEFTLGRAADSGDVAWVQAMLTVGADARFDSNGNTALHCAVRADAREVAQLLLERGADPDAPDVDMDRPMYAATSREMVALLIEYGADSKAINCCGTPVWESIRDPWVKSFAEPG